VGWMWPGCGPGWALHSVWGAGCESRALCAAFRVAGGGGSAGRGAGAGKALCVQVDGATSELGFPLDTQARWAVFPVHIRRQSVMNEPQ
jgi:hypothetical protein